MSSLYSNLSQEPCFNSFAAFRVENSSGQGFDLLWAGPNATNVPQEATIVDNQNQDVVLSNPFQWGRADGVQYYRGAMTWTTVAGASLNFSFDGVAIWYACVSYT